MGKRLNDCIRNMSLGFCTIGRSSLLLGAFPIATTNVLAPTLRRAFVAAESSLRVFVGDVTPAVKTTTI